eukprot:gene4517-14678_t
MYAAQQREDYGHQMMMLKLEKGELLHDYQVQLTRLDYNDPEKKHLQTKIRRLKEFDPGLEPPLPVDWVNDPMWREDGLFQLQEEELLHQRDLLTRRWQRERDRRQQQMAEVANRGELLRNADRIDWENAGEPMWDVEEAVSGVERVGA